MNAVQLNQTIAIILECYPHYKIEDFVRFFKNVKKLQYGKLYEGLDGGKIMDMLHQYDQERESEIEEYHRKKNSLYKEESKTFNEHIVKAMRQFAEKPEPKKEVPQTTITRQRTAQEKIIDGWMEEFEHLYRKEFNNKVDRQPIRMITIKGKPTDINAFLNQKLEDYETRRKGTVQEGKK